MTTTTRDTRTATQAYQENLTALAETLKKLQAGLRKHRKEQAKDPLNWGLVGDLSYALDLAQQAARFINGEDE